MPCHSMRLDEIWWDGSDAMGHDVIGLDGIGILLRTWQRKGGVRSVLVRGRGRIGLDLELRQG